jgi:hypothetical protein
MTKIVKPIEGIWWLPGERRRFRHGVLQQLPTGDFELTLRTAWRRDVMATVDRAELQIERQMGAGEQGS